MNDLEKNKILKNYFSMYEEFGKEDVFEEMELQELDLSGISLYGSKFSCCTFKNIRFDECSIKLIRFEICHFENCKLIMVDGTNSIFTDSTFINCSFNKSIFTGASFFDCEFNKCDFSRARLDDISIDGCKFINTVFFEATTTKPFVSDSLFNGEESISSKEFLHNYISKNNSSWANISNNQGYKIINLTQGSKEWLKWRSKGIGGSDVPTIMGENPWKSRNYLIQEKLGNKKIWGGNQATSQGQKYEPIIRAQIEKDLGLSIIPLCIQSRKNRWMRASLDGITHKGDKVIEIKFGKKVYSHVHQNNAPPEYHNGQLQHIIHLTGLDAIDYYCGAIDQPTIHLSIKKDELYIEKMLENEHLFIKELLDIDINFLHK